MYIYVAPQKSKLLLALCKSGMMVFDISKVGKYNPEFSIPLVMNLHKPAVTSMEYVDNCSDNLTSSLYSVHSKQLAKDKTVKVVSTTHINNFYVWAYTCAYAHTQASTQIQACAHTYCDTHTHTHTHTYNTHITHTQHTYTHTHIHTQHTH